MLGFEGDTSFQAQSQTKAGIAVDFDMISMLALVYAINTLGPQKTVNSFLGFWGDAFGAIAAGLGNVLGGGVDWVADGVGGGVDWLGDQLGL
ncbi:MAG: hypothetical protein ACXAEN_19470 [Candidatus Thorarchaeota archaeon]